MKPLIAITAGTALNPRTGDPEGLVTLSRDYVRRVQNAGGIPLVLPPGTEIEALAPLIDGWLIPGGDDFDAALWGEETHPEAKLGPQDRLQTEIALYKAVPGNLPVLGICYGAQFINIMQGGALEQHLPDRLGHDNHRGDHLQTYQIEPDTLAHKIFGPAAQGKSWHHQAVARLGKDLQVSARHEDGTIEAIEATAGRWFVGLQWHPERTDVPESELPFQAFVQAATAFRQAKSLGNQA